MAFNVNNDLINGDDILFYVTSGHTVVAFATSCSIQVDGETISTANKMSCRWNSNLAGKNGYTVSVDSLYTQASGETSFDALMAMMIAGEAVDWAIGPSIDESDVDCDDRTYALDTTAIYYSGKGIITSLSLNAGNNEVASCSMTLTGSGELTKNN